MSKTPESKHDWSGADAMTEAEIHAAALPDPDATASAYLVVIDRNPDTLSPPP